MSCLQIGTNSHECEFFRAHQDPMILYPYNYINFIFELLIIIPVLFVFPGTRTYIMHLTQIFSILKCLAVPNEAP